MPDAKPFSDPTPPPQRLRPVEITERVKAMEERIELLENLVANMLDEK